jgi:hypothetical protein
MGGEQGNATVGLASDAQTGVVVKRADVNYAELARRLTDMGELWPNLGDDGLREAAYRGGWKPA